MAETSKCPAEYKMGVYNSETNEVEEIGYPCEKGAGHDLESAHEFEKDGQVYPWFDTAQINRLRNK